MMRQLFISGTLFLILFVMFLVFSLSQTSHRLRPLAMWGILMTVLYEVQLLRISGYQDSVNRVISNHVLSLIIMVLRFAVIGCGIMVFYRLLPNGKGRRMQILSEIFLAAGLLMNVIAVFFRHWYTGWFCLLVSSS